MVAAIQHQAAASARLAGVRIVLEDERPFKCLWGPTRAVSINWGVPLKSLFKGSFEGDRAIGVDTDVDMDIDSDIAAFVNWGILLKGLWRLLRGLGLI